MKRQLEENWSLTIRKMLPSDIFAVAGLHNKYFGGFFLQKMGVPLLIKYYEILLIYDNAIAYVYENEFGVLEGFVAGFINPQKFYRKFRNSFFLLIVPVGLGLIRQPSLILKVLNNTLRINNNSKERAMPMFDSEKTAELSSIAVSNHSAGLGTLLIQEFIDMAWKCDVESVESTTDGDDNDKAKKFYTKNGLRKKGVIMRKGRVLEHYTIVNPKNRI